MAQPCPCPGRGQNSQVVAQGGSSPRPEGTLGRAGRAETQRCGGDLGRLRGGHGTPSARGDTGRRVRGILHHVAFSSRSGAGQQHGGGRERPQAGGGVLGGPCGGMQITEQETCAWGRVTRRHQRLSGGEQSEPKTKDADETKNRKEAAVSILQPGVWARPGGEGQLQARSRRRVPRGLLRKEREGQAT